MVPGRKRARAAVLAAVLAATALGVSNEDAEAFLDEALARGVLRTPAESSAKTKE